MELRILSKPELQIAITAYRQMRGWSRDRFCEECGVKKSRLADYFRKGTKSTLRLDTEDYLKITVQLGIHPLIKRIPVKGEIARGAFISMLTVEREVEITLPPGMPLSAEMEGYEAIDDSNAPFAYRGDVVVIGAKRGEVKPFDRRPYWIKTRDGEIAIRTLIAGPRTGYFTLINPSNAEVSENVELESWADILMTINKNALRASQPSNPEPSVPERTHQLHVVR